MRSACNPVRLFDIFVVEHAHSSSENGLSLRVRPPPDQNVSGPASTPAGHFSGDHTGGVTPVPIPNTAVKPARPMIVPLARKSVIAGILYSALDQKFLVQCGIFLRAIPIAPAQYPVRLANAVSPLDFEPRIRLLTNV
jgi:hypothetical protein